MRMGVVAACVAVLLIATATASSSSSGSAPLVVETVNGPVRGVSDRGVREFLGIPFAEPPLGELRFKRTQPLKSNWTGVYDAGHFAPDCAQHRNGLADFNRSEDCLYLNVYAPTEIPSKPLPVVLFFYGGTWQVGGTSFFLYNGDGIVRLVEDVIVVTTNYRLGPFGFLGSSALAAEDPLNSTGNYGLQDQRMAMQWVQDNIAAFGGDPNTVAIWGQSAGGGSVSAHLTAKASWPFFHRAMMDSGPPANWTAAFLDQNQAHFDRIAAALDCTGSDSEILACLRNESTATLLDAEENPHLPTPVNWSPTIDGVEFDRAIPQIVEAGDFNKVPILFGTNRNEGTLLTLCPQDANATEYAKQFNELFLNHSSKAQALYPIKDYGQPFFAVAEAFGDMGMTCPARRAARWFSHYGSDVYLYYFTHTPIVTSWDPWLGVFHGAELLFLWQSPLMLPEEYAMADTMTDYWTSFVASGNPNGNGTKVEWPAYTQANNQNMNINYEFVVENDLKTEVCDFWDVYYNMTTGAWDPWGPWHSLPSSSF